MKTNNNTNTKPIKTKQQISSTLKHMLYEHIKNNLLEPSTTADVYTNNNHKNNKVINISIFDNLLDIDNFVEKILFQNKTQSKQNTQNWIYDAFEKISNSNSLMDFALTFPNYNPSPKIQLFYSLYERILQAIPNTHPPKTIKENIDTLVYLIKNSEETKTYKKNLTYKISQAHKNQKSITSYIDNIFYTHGKLTVIRFDLAYKYSNYQNIDFETAFLHKKNFLNNIRKHADFKKIYAGYVANIEYNMYKGGYYFHYFFFFLDSPYLPIQNLITDVWESRITQGMGKCTPYFYPLIPHQNSLGTGTISQATQKSRNQLQLAIEFIIYKSIHFDIIPDLHYSKKKFRTLFRGEEKVEKLFR